MAELSIIDAGKLRMVHLRVSHLELYVPDVKKLSSGGQVGIETDLEIEIVDDQLEVTSNLTANISTVPEEDAGDDVSPEEAGKAIVEYVATYELPQDHGLTDDDLERLEPAYAQTFLHALQPMQVFRLKSLLQESGAVNPRIPPHIYATTE